MGADNRTRLPQLPKKRLHIDPVFWAGCFGNHAKRINEFPHLMIFLSVRPALRQRVTKPLCQTSVCGNLDGKVIIRSERPKKDRKSVPRRGQPVTFNGIENW